MSIVSHHYRLAPVYGLVISLLPVVVAMQEFWPRMHPLLAFAFIYMLLAMTYYALRDYKQELETGGHEGGHGPTRSAHLVMVAVFALGCFGAWPLLCTFAFGHAGWNLPVIIPSDNRVVADTVAYGTAAVLLVSIYWLAHRFPGVKFDFYLRWRWSPWDAVIIALLALATVGGLLVYMEYFAAAHAPMNIFGSRAGSTPVWAYWTVGIGFALINALIEEFWFRGLLMGALKQLLPMRRVIVLQAVVFGIFHWFGTPQGILGVVLAGTWGGLLGWWVYVRGSLWPAVTVHFLAGMLIFAYTN